MRETFDREGKYVFAHVGGVLTVAQMIRIIEILQSEHSIAVEDARKAFDVALKSDATEVPVASFSIKREGTGGESEFVLLREYLEQEKISYRIIASRESDGYMVSTVAGKSITVDIQDGIVFVPLNQTKDAEDQKRTSEFLRFADPDCDYLPPLRALESARETMRFEYAVDELGEHG